jgi:hypothetical protein
MTTQAVTIEDLEKDILERAGIERRDDLPITVEAAWGGETYQTGEEHPKEPFLIYAIYQDADEIRLYALPKPAQNGGSEKDKLRRNPSRFTLTKTARTAVVEVMTMDVFADANALELRWLFDSLYPPDEPDKPEEKQEKQAPPPPLVG